MIIAALYLLWAYQRVFQGEPDEENAKFPDLKLTERLVMVPLLVLIVFLGIYPKPVLDRIEPSVNRILTRMEEQVDRYDEPTTQNGSELGPIEVHEGEAGAEGEHAASCAAHEPGGGAVSPALLAQVTTQTPTPISAVPEQLHVAGPSIYWPALHPAADPAGRRPAAADLLVVPAQEGAPGHLRRRHRGHRRGGRAQRPPGLGPGPGLELAPLVGHPPRGHRALHDHRRHGRRRRLHAVRHHRDLRRRRPWPPCSPTPTCAARTWRAPSSTSSCSCRPPAA